MWDNRHFITAETDEYSDQLLAEMYPDEPLRDVLKNIMDEPISEEVKRRLLTPLLLQRYKPVDHPRKRKERKRRALLREFDLFCPQRKRNVTSYQNGILGLFDVAKPEGVEKVAGWRSFIGDSFKICMKI